jgi:hypothetical protein
MHICMLFLVYSFMRLERCGYSIGRCQRRQWQIATGTTPATNLHPVSTTSVANNGNNYQTADNLKWTWRKKYICMQYAISTTQRCPKEIMKTFLIEDFFHLPPVSTIPVVHLELRISPQIFEKIRNGPYGIIRGLGETDLCRKPKAKNSWHCPFKL